MSLYNRLNPQAFQTQQTLQPQSTGNPVLDMFGNFNNFQQQFNQFATQIRNSNTNPQEAVQRMLNSGQMSQEQFNRLSQMANMITGHKQF